MSLAVVHSRAQNGIEAPPVTVEVHLANGLPALSIVGLPEAAVKESKDRVRSAIINSRFEFPSKRITVNLAPADLPKEGGRFDLPIAIGILAASGQIPNQGLNGYEFLGELALTGELRPIRGTLSAALNTKQDTRTLVVARDNADEAALAHDVEVLAANHLLDITAHLNGTAVIAPHTATTVEIKPGEQPDLSQVRGQHRARRALEIAAAGGHNLLFIGPPGAGKTLLASCLPGIMPSMNDDEALETAALQSIGDKGFSITNWKQRPFRAPHHTASAVALVGGGGHPRPGEISLAHHGVLFLDELPEFDRRVLEVLREPLESGHITISRAARQSDFPAQFQLVAAMNPCPCGFLGDASGRCHCTADAVRRYRSRISGPLLDRIDMHIEVAALPREQLLKPGGADGEASNDVRIRVEAARKQQQQRLGKPNARMNNKEIEHTCVLGDGHYRLLDKAVERLNLSARAYHRILRVARTIADLAGEDAISEMHLTEAIGYRCLDKLT